MIKSIRCYKPTIVYCRNNNRTLIRVIIANNQCLISKDLFFLFLTLIKVYTFLAVALVKLYIFIENESIEVLGIIDY